MTQQLDFQLDWEDGGAESEYESLTYGSLGIFVDGKPVTRVEDRISRTTRSEIRVSGYPLALWLASNWWRLRWEGPDTGGSDWEMAHNVAAAGSGYVWPDLEIFSFGDEVTLTAEETPKPSVESIEYLGNLHEKLSGSEFVRAVDEFIEAVIARLTECGQQDTPLEQIWSVVKEERADPVKSEYRRLEALLGYDAEQGPSEKICELLEVGDRLGADAIAEVAASNAEGFNWEELETKLQTADSATIPDLESLRQVARKAATGQFAWQRGESAAREIRSTIQQTSGPLEDSTLEQWLSLPSNKLQNAPESVSSFAAGFREEANSEDIRLLLRSGWRTGRRFEVARLIGEHLITAPEEDHMMPATKAKTARQATQRAFGAELLLPMADLKDAIGSTPVDEEKIEDIAAEFEVSPVMVQTRLVNKDLMSRSRLE